MKLLLFIELLIGSYTGLPGLAIKFLLRRLFSFTKACREFYAGIIYINIFYKGKNKI